jgi:hypothetical protein
MLRAESVYPHQRIEIVLPPSDLQTDDGIIVSTEVEAIDDDRRIRIPAHVANRCMDSGVVPSVHTARLATLKRGSLWKPRDPALRLNLTAQILRQSKNDKEPVAYITGGQPHVERRRDFLTRYAPLREMQAENV